MATLSLVGGSGQFTWTISGLNNWFASNQYMSAGVTTVAFSEGATSISGVVDRVYATADGTSFSVSHTVTYSSGVYEFYGFAQGSDGTYWPTGSGSVEVTSTDAWSWSASSARQQAYDFLMGNSNAGFPASVWNSFVNYMDRTYTRYFDGDSWSERISTSRCLPKSQCLVSVGQSLSADILKSVCMQVAYGAGLSVPDVQPEDEFKGSYVIDMVQAFNDEVKKW